MRLNCTNTKYSIFGKYDDLKYDSKNVAKLFNPMSEFGFLPKELEIFGLNPMKNEVIKLSRLQFKHEQEDILISFYPDRIDIDANMGSTVNVCKAVDYYVAILDTFELDVSRLAYNTAVLLVPDIEDKEQKDYIGKSIVDKKYFLYSDELLEWDTREIARIDCQVIDEQINVGQSLTRNSFTVDKDGLNGVGVNIDINTLAEDQTPRFHKDKIKSFFVQAEIINKKILDNLMAAEII